MANYINSASISNTDSASNITVSTTGHALSINYTNLLSTLGNYALTSSLSTYATTASLANYINSASISNTDSASNITVSTTGHALSINYTNLLSTLGNYALTSSLSSYATTASLALKAPLASPTFTGTVSLSGATVTGLTGYAPTASPTFTGTVSLSGATVTGLTGYAPLASPVFTGTLALAGVTVTGLSTSGYATTSYVTGLGYAPSASPTFTGTVTATGATVLLSNYYKSVTTTTTDAATNIVLTGSGTGLTLNYNNLLIALGNLQPLSSCLSNLPNNINSTQTSWFTPLFPTDQPLWTTFTSASSANTTNSNVPIYTQTLTFTASTSQVSLTINNFFTSASCTVSMGILFGTATSFGWGVYSVGSTGTTNITQDVLSANLPVLGTPTAYNTISLAFTTPSSGTFTLRCGPNIASSGASGIGTVSITNVCMYSGTSQIMLCRGSFSAPFGNISANSLTANSIWSYYRRAVQQRQQSDDQPLTTPAFEQHFDCHTNQHKRQQSQLHPDAYRYNLHYMDSIHVRNVIRQAVHIRPSPLPNTGSLAEIYIPNTYPNTSLHLKHERGLGDGREFLHCRV